MTIIYYEGERIYFRPIELDDEPALRRWVNDPKIWHTLGHRAPVNSCTEREWIENQAKDESAYIFAIMAKDGDRFIGTTGLHQIHHVHHRATFGLMIGDVAAQNQGFGTEATQLAVRYGFEEVNLHRIRLEVYAFNDRAIRVYEKAGFTREGCFRDSTWRAGRYIDTLQYAILRDDWFKMQHRDKTNAGAQLTR